MKEYVEKLIKEFEETDINDIQMIVRETLLKYGFPYECIVQDEIWNALDGLSSNKFAIQIVNQLAKEYKQEPSKIIETVKIDRLNCEVPSDYFSEIKEVRVIDEWTEEIKVFKEVQDGGIPSSERLPKTNYDRIREMTEEEMLDLLMGCICRGECVKRGMVEVA